MELKLDYLDFSFSFITSEFGMISTFGMDIFSCSMKLAYLYLLLIGLISGDTGLLL